MILQCSLTEIPVSDMETNINPFSTVEPKSIPKKDMRILPVASISPEYSGDNK
jgi:hypothetical protein